MSSRVLATQTDSASAADGPGPPPTGICDRSSPLSGSSTPTVFSAISVPPSSLPGSRAIATRPTRDDHAPSTSSAGNRRTHVLGGLGVAGRGRPGPCRPSPVPRARVLAQYRLVQLSQLGPGLDPDLADESLVARPGRPRARPPAARSGKAPASTGSEGARALDARRSAARARTRRPHGGRAPGRPRAGLERHDAKLVEPRRLGLGEGLEGKVGQRLASP